VKVKGFLSVFLCLFTVGVWTYGNYQELDHLIKKKQFVKVREKLGDKILTGKGFPQKVLAFDNEFRVEYTHSSELTLYLRSLLKIYPSDYSVIVVLDNKTGAVLASVGKARGDADYMDYLAFSSNHPSASLFKIITSASLLEHTSLAGESPFRYRGRRVTLYKSQLKNAPTHWDRKTSFKKAFANSNNVVFGKAAINNLSADLIFQTALDFGFNKELMVAVPLGVSQFKRPENDYHLAELATGFNRETLISPIHGALLSLVVANEGILTYPRLVSRVLDSQSNEVLFENLPYEKRVIDSETSKELERMMRLTITQGTARGGFARLRRSLKNDLYIGGKTGSITGGVPHGKRDWITLFARPKHRPLDPGISICVMNINVKKWYVKSSFLAKQVIDYYYRRVDPIASRVTKL
jgi:membrane carboxypeptidase/penicillin-binding protein